MWFRNRQSNTSDRGATIRSLRKFHGLALTVTFVCLAVAVGACVLLFRDLSADVTLPFPGMWMLTLAMIVLALGGIVLTSLVLYRSVNAVRNDIRSLVQMFKDVRQGAVRVDYPVELAEFAAAQRYLRGWGEEMLAERERLKDMGLIDHLSQLSNRRHFEIRLKEMFDKVHAHGPSSVLILDVDQFKQVNDHYGHDTGDALIQQFAALLRAHVRLDDTLARLGGDEFCVIYTYVPLNKASVLADRLRRSLPREIELKPGVLHSLRWSGGLSVMLDEDAKPDDVLRRADQALLRAKEAGRNRIIVDRSVDEPSKPAAGEPGNP